eukprot:7292182-Alexandrium_andersonii.AAC.1
MSASLVGSEMCIRDRLSNRRWPRQWSGGAARSCHGELGARTLDPRAFTSVSYTHLTLPTICSV